MSLAPSKVVMVAVVVVVVVKTGPETVLGSCFILV